MTRLASLLVMFSISTFILLSCEKGDDELNASQQAEGEEELCANAGCALDRIYETDEGRFLYSGTDSSSHFNISNWSLQPEKLRDHGLEREAFPALMDPKFAPLQDVEPAYNDRSKFIIVKGKNEVRAYPYVLLTFHEVVNDVMDGKAFLVGYCVLADFAAVYSREFCGNTFTFGVSGYTYLNNMPDTANPVQAFILWDRDTESLWNPLENRAVSHTMHNFGMEVYPEQNWEVVNLKTLTSEYPEARVLKSNQPHQIPSDWLVKSCDELPCCN